MDIQNPFNGPVYYKEQTHSTMEDALQAAASGAPAGTLCWTSWQSQGRGRLPGRVWYSTPGESLMMTLLLDQSLLNLKPTLSLRVGLALAKTLESFDLPDLKIKWPNDIYSGGKKLCGILCEFRQGVLLAGIGINMNQQAFPEDLPRAGSLRMINGELWEAETLLNRLLLQMKDSLYQEIPLSEWNQRLMFCKENVRILTGDPAKGEIVQGVLRGISRDGALLLDEKYIYSGELQF